MKVLEIKNIVREDGVIYYRKSFTADAVIEIPQKTIETPVAFTVEMTPLGSKNVDITFLEDVEYPLLPIIQQMKKIIKEKDYEGQLL